MKLGVPVLVNFEGLVRLIESAERGSLAPSGYVIVFNGGDLSSLPNRPWRSKIHAVIPDENIGVAASWNKMLELGEPIVIANDDVVLGERTFEEMTRDLETHRIVGNGWCLFGQTPECTQTVGFYDENFWPGYYEDSDYAVRLVRAGVSGTWNCSEPVQHAGCWTTFNALGRPDWMAVAIEQSRLYFVQKWGGMPDSETYSKPFDGRIPDGWSLRPKASVRCTCDREVRARSRRVRAALEACRGLPHKHVRGQVLEHRTQSYGGGKMTARIMVGVPCFAEPRELLLSAIRSFLSPETHVVAIENGATADVKSVLREMGASISVVRNDVNVYVNPAWNQLAEIFLASEHDVLVLANADLIASPNWTKSLLMRCDSAEQREYWIARLLNENEIYAPLEPSADSTATDYVHGAFFAMSREAVSIAFPIPSELLIHCGDDWIYWLLRWAGFAQRTVHGMGVWHKGAVSGSSLHEFDAITESDRIRWDSGLNKICTALGKIERQYHQCEIEPSDINEHISVLSMYASKCAHVTEFGAGRSTWGLLRGRPKSMRSYDIRHLDMRELSEIAAAAKIDFRFCVESALAASIEKTDLLFIDTIHNYAQLRCELFVHESKVRKHILMHDTTTYGSRDESESGLGLWPAIVEFLDAHSDWRLENRLSNNNGLTILTRKSTMSLEKELG